MFIREAEAASLESTLTDLVQQATGTDEVAKSVTTTKTEKSTTVELSSTPVANAMAEPNTDNKQSTNLEPTEVMVTTTMNDEACTEG